MFYIKTFSKPYLGQGLFPHEVQGRATCRATPLIFHALRTPEVLPLHIIKASEEILIVVEGTLTMPCVIPPPPPVISIKYPLGITQHMNCWSAPK